MGPVEIDFDRSKALSLAATLQSGSWSNLELLEFAGACWAEIGRRAGLVASQVPVETQASEPSSGVKLEFEDPNDPTLPHNQLIASLWDITNAYDWLYRLLNSGIYDKQYQSTTRFSVSRDQNNNAQMHLLEGKLPLN